VELNGEDLSVRWRGETGEGREGEEGGGGRRRGVFLDWEESRGGKNSFFLLETMA